jgi:PHP family Zn ribbon phosphoesterase
MKADLHIHTVLSPCGDIEMTPAYIVRRAKELGIGIVGISDHNSTLQSREIRRIGEREGIYVLCGAEITTREEVHVLAFVDGDDNIDKLQAYLSAHLPPIPNNTDYFGYQLVVNEAEEVLAEEPYLLINAIDQSIEQIEEFVHSLGGIFIPAHIDKPQNSLLSQLGFVPPHLNVEALEVSHRCNLQELIAANPYLAKYSFTRASDAHYPEELGRAAFELDVHEPLSFAAIKDALKRTDILH